MTLPSPHYWTGSYDGEPHFSWNPCPPASVQKPFDQGALSFAGLIVVPVELQLEAQNESICISDLDKECCMLTPGVHM